MREHAGDWNDVYDQTADASRAAVGRASRRSRLIAVALLVSTGCASLVPGRGGSSDDWTAVLSTAKSQASHGEFASADSLLAGFAATHPGTPAALETAYWRGLFRLDPSNRGASVVQALASLDAYIADSRPKEHAVEAASIRRAAAQLDALNKLAAAASAQAKDAASTAANAKAAAADAKASDANASATVDAKDVEIKKLRDDLAKANAELDRIRKRLGAPPPHP